MKKVLPIVCNFPLYTCGISIALLIQSLDPSCGNLRWLRAGSVVLCSHNVFHRANHRRDDWRTWNDRPRFMWRFWLYRTTEPTDSRENGTSAELDWDGLGMDPLTRADLTQAGDDLTEVWRHHYCWMNAG